MFLTSGLGQEAGQFIGGNPLSLSLSFRSSRYAELQS
jgi:hypothetical protein